MKKKRSQQPQNPPALSLDRRVIRRLRLRHFELIAALHDTRGMLKAAERLNVTQPAVTKALQDVEQTLGLELFVRSNRGLVPTHYGDVLSRHAKGVLSQLRHAAEELQNLRDGVGGHATVGTLVAASAELLPRAIIALKRERPQVAITVVSATYDVLLPLLRVGDLDLVLGRLPEGPHSESFVYEEFYGEPTCVVARRKHPLARRSRLRLEDLLDEAWLLPTPESQLRRQVDRVFIEAKLPAPRDLVESMSVPTNLRLLDGSDIIAVMPFHVVRHEVKQGRFVILPIDLPGTESPVGVMTRAPGELRPSAAALLDELRRVGRSIAADV